MKPKKFSIFRRISIMIFAFITAMCLLFMGITYLSTTNFHQASTQLLNKDVAAHIAVFTSPFESDGINMQKADSVFQNAMVLSPSVEVYFLDTTGKVIAFHAPKNSIQLWNLPLENIKKLIDSHGSQYIKGPDPKEPDNPKIFSAAEVKGKDRNLGYIYVILGSNKSITDMLYASYFGSLLVKVFCVIIALSLIFSFIYLNRFQQSFNRILLVLERFQNGDLEARFKTKEHDELSPVTSAFNKMADLLVYNINRLTKSEKERKDFIANISHDLRTPLSVARGYTETLLIKNEKQEITKQQQQEFMQLVLNKIGQVEHMVKQLFELSKMESVEFTPQKEPFVFSEILQEIITALTPSMAEKQIITDSSRYHDTSWINADIGMMERVVQNLLVNAIKYTPPNGRIDISLETQNNQLLLTISNTGEAITPELLHWINTSSEEANQIISRPSNSGIGLMIVKKILHLHNYSLQAKATVMQNQFHVSMHIYDTSAQPFS